MHNTQYTILSLASFTLQLHRSLTLTLHPHTLHPVDAGGGQQELTCDGRPDEGCEALTHDHQSKGVGQPLEPNQLHHDDGPQ